MLDLLIKNARVIDGTGADAYIADVGVQSGKISEVGNINLQDARLLRTSLDGVDFTSSHLDRVKFELCSLKECVFAGMDLSECAFVAKRHERLNRVREIVLPIDHGAKLGYLRRSKRRLVALTRGC